MVKVHNAQKGTDRVELTKKTSHYKSRVFLQKRRLKMDIRLIEACFMKKETPPNGFQAGTNSSYIK